MSAEKEMKESDRLFASLIRSIEERQTEARTEIDQKQKAAETRSKELIDELQAEIAELQRRNAEMEELRNTEDHLHLLQVTIILKLWWIQKGFNIDSVVPEQELGEPYNNAQISSFSQRSPSLMSPPPTKEWMEISVHPELIVGTARKALSKVDDTVKNELDRLKTEGKVLK